MKQPKIKIKMRCSDKKQNRIRELLRKNHAEYIRTDYQVDTYFKARYGTFKLIRKSDLEKHLLFYKRKNKKNSKKPRAEPYPLSVEKIIREENPILVEVDKTREIYFIGNVEFRLDYVKNLGSFIEIRAFSEENKFSKEKLKKQCDHYQNLFEIKPKELISDSYSDMLLKLKKKNALDRKIQTQKI